MNAGPPLLAARAAAKRFGSQLALEALWLAGLGAVFGVVARHEARRLLA